MTAQQHPVRVAAVARLTPWISEYYLQAVDGSPLPAFSPGSHVVLELPLTTGAAHNAYSLTSSPFDRSHYRIAVRKQTDSRGGSRFLHEELQLGQLLRIESPRNFFPIKPPPGGAPLLFIAGGIGVTPFMAYLQSPRRLSGQLQMHYAFRERADAAYVRELQELLGADLHRYEGSRGQRLDVTELLAAQRLGTRLYVCGPASLIDAVREQATALGWPDGSVHYERFSMAGGGAPFRVRLQRSRRSIQVGADESLLEALERERIPVRSLCRAGVCGECRTPLLAGQADHQDLFLSDREKAGQCAVMPCVSRASPGGELLLDL